MDFYWFSVPNWLLILSDKHQSLRKVNSRSAWPGGDGWWQLAILLARILTSGISICNRRNIARCAYEREWAQKALRRSRTPEQLPGKSHGCCRWHGTWATLTAAGPPPRLASTHPWAFGPLSPATDCRPGMAAASKEPESPTGLTSHRLASQPLTNRRKRDSGHAELTEVSECLNKDHAVRTPHSGHATAALPHFPGYIPKPALYQL